MSRAIDTPPEVVLPPEEAEVVAASHDPIEREAEAFLERFHRPARPPSPEPERRAQSDGGNFVAHYTVATPAAPSHREATDPGVHVRDETQGDLASLIRVEAPPRGALGSRDESTVVPAEMQRRRAVRGAVVMLAVLALASLVAAASLRTSPSAAAPPAPAPTPVESAPDMPRATITVSAVAQAPAPPIAQQVSSSLTGARGKAPAQAPARDAPRAAPKLSPRAKDPTTDMLPDEP